MTKKIIAIGGGEIGTKGYQIETALIDKEIINLTNKEHPNLLFLPTASNDSQIYVDAARKHFGQKLGCKVDYLFLIKQKPTRSQIIKKINKADIIYVGGGSTLRLMQVLRRNQVDRLLREAYERGKVMSGLSAGAICWFRYGLSDSRLFQKGSNKSFMRVGV